MLSDPYLHDLGAHWSPGRVPGTIVVSFWVEFGELLRRIGMDYGMLEWILKLFWMDFLNFRSMKRCIFGSQFYWSQDFGGSFQVSPLPAGWTPARDHMSENGWLRGVVVWHVFQRLQDWTWRPKFASRNSEKRLRTIPNPSQILPKRSPRPSQIRFMYEFWSFFYHFKICMVCLSFFWMFFNARKLKNHDFPIGKPHFLQNRLFQS